MRNYAMVVWNRCLLSVIWCDFPQWVGTISEYQLLIGSVAIETFELKKGAGRGAEYTEETPMMSSRAFWLIGTCC